MIEKLYDSNRWLKTKRVQIIDHTSVKIYSNGKTIEDKRSES